LKNINLGLLNFKKNAILSLNVDNKSITSESISGKLQLNRDNVIRYKEIGIKQNISLFVFA